MSETMLKPTTPALQSAVRPATIEEVQTAVQSADRVVPHGARTKPALVANADALYLDMRGLTGILEYDPGEYTFTALAGTPLAQIAAAVAEHGQTMPFDPPLVAAGATLGGTIAAGLSGSGRYRYGGLRDFILGVRIVDGQGRLIRGGGKVVKNAAGFDLPKLMVGSLGRLGIIVEASFKVFPAPPATATLQATYATLADAMSAMGRLMQGPYDLEALDLVAAPDGYQLMVQIGGPATVLPARLARLQTRLGAGAILDDDAATAHWQRQRELAWVPGDHSLVKVPLTLHAVAALDVALASQGALRVYAGGANLAWMAWPGAVDELHALLLAQQLSGLVVKGQVDQPMIGVATASPFRSRIRQALDPTQRFLDFDR